MAWLEKSHTMDFQLGWYSMFYNRLTPNTKMVIDVAAGGALMVKERDKAYELLEEMMSNSYQ